MCIMTEYCHLLDDIWHCILSEQW